MMAAALFSTNERIVLPLFGMIKENHLYEIGRLMN